MAGSEAVAGTEAGGDAVAANGAVAGSGRDAVTVGTLKLRESCGAR
mgnify:CR=1 FL=1